MQIEGVRAERAGRSTVVSVVGIGASAGGLAAIEAFSGMPAKAKADPADGMDLRPNCAYIVPPNRIMSCGELPAATIRGARR